MAAMSGDEIFNYREQAEYCRQQASKARDPTDKAAWLKVAGDWLRMAENAEQRGGREEAR